MHPNSFYWVSRSLNLQLFPFQVTLASRPALDAWYGARDWALEHLPTGSGAAAEGWISRQDYEEKGGEYLSEHSASNIFIPMKLSKAAPSRPTEPSVTTATTAAASAGVVTLTMPPTVSSSPAAVASADVSTVTA